MNSHPYIPNSAETVRARILMELGIGDTEELLTAIPGHLRSGPLDLPEPILSEQELRAHVSGILAANKVDLVSFLGSDCYRHYVPAICDEINSRNEFLTAYSGRAYEDHGRYQALFEYASMMGELLNMDVVSLPTYDGYQAAATALRMAGRFTSRRRVLVAQSTATPKLSKFEEYCRPALDLEPLGWDRSGKVDIRQLEMLIQPDVAGVYLDHPNGFGVLETDLQQITDIAHKSGALVIVGVDPTLLGVLTPPGDLGADIVCGDLQPLGMHPQFGGGHAGFIASSDNPAIVHEYPIRLYSVAPTVNPGEYGFGEVDSSRTSFVAREKGKEWLGTTANLWGITAGVYLALMGPSGMEELGHHLLGRARYLSQRVNELPGVKPRFASPHGKEFLIDFSESGREVSDIHAGLLRRGIIGGADMSTTSGLEGCALYCTTELHSRADLDLLVDAIREEIAG